MSQAPYPLSRNIPALFIRIVTVPKLSTAVLIIAAPSDTDEVFAMALPPAESNEIGIGQHREGKIRTPGNLINYLLRSGSIEVIDNDVCTSGHKKVRVPIQTQETEMK